MECYKKICSTRNKAKCSCNIKTWLVGTCGILKTLIDWLRHSCSQAKTLSTCVGYAARWKDTRHVRPYLSFSVNTCINKYIKSVVCHASCSGFKCVLAPTHTHWEAQVLKHTTRGKAQSQVNNTLSSKVAGTDCTLWGDFSRHCKPAMPLDSGLANRYFNTASLR